MWRHAMLKSKLVVAREYSKGEYETLCDIYRKLKYRGDRVHVAEVGFGKPWTL